MSDAAPGQTAPAPRGPGGSFAGRRGTSHTPSGSGRIGGRMSARMSEHQNRVCVYAPCASGGHARYAWELTTALARHAHGRHRFELVSSQDLEPQFRSTEYPVHAILP